MRVTLAIQPKITVNRDLPSKGTVARWVRALRWLGDRHLCHKPINRKTENV
jgi:hypothetical protein